MRILNILLLSLLVFIFQCKQKNASENVTNGGQSGLIKRRNAEYNMFLKNSYDSTH